MRTCQLNRSENEGPTTRQGKVRWRDREKGSQKSCYQPETRANVEEGLGKGVQEEEKAGEDKVKVVVAVRFLLLNQLPRQCMMKAVVARE